MKWRTVAKRLAPVAVVLALAAAALGQPGVSAALVALGEALGEAAKPSSSSSNTPPLAPLDPTQ